MLCGQAAELAAGKVREQSFRAFLTAGGASLISSLDLDILSFTVRLPRSDNVTGTGWVFDEILTRRSGVRPGGSLMCALRRRNIWCPYVRRILSWPRLPRSIHRRNLTFVCRSA